MPNTKIEKKLDSFFDSVVEQDRVKNNVKSAILGYINGLRLPSFAFFGAAGLGKTHLMRCTDEALSWAIELVSAKKTDRKSLWLDSADALATLSSEAFLTLREALRDIRPFVLHIDEAQSLYQGYCGPSKTALHNFIKQALDGASKDGRALEFKTLNQPIHVCHRTFSINIGTNFPDTIKDKDAVHRRFNVQRLEPYSVEGLALITQRKLARMGIKADERTLLLVGRCGRGTCETPDKISEKLAEIAANSNKKTVNKADVLNALKALTMFPRGLTEREVQILNICSEGRVKTSNLGIMLKIQRQGILDSLGYLMSQRHENGQPLPLVIEANGYVETTDAGKRYLQSLKADKFLIPA